MKILNFGSCNIDYVYSLDHIVVPGYDNRDKAPTDRDMEYVYHICRNALMDDMIRSIASLG